MGRQCLPDLFDLGSGWMPAAFATAIPCWWNEDLNPYLSLDRVAPEVAESFVAAMTAAIRTLAGR